MRDTKRASVVAALALVATAAFAGQAPTETAANQCWSHDAQRYSLCGDGVMVMSRRNPGNYGDWNEGMDRRWQDIPANWAVYVCELALPVNAGDGCPTWQDASARFVVKSEVIARLAASTPPVTPAPPPTQPPAGGDGVAALSWYAPTQYTDGSSLPASALSAYRVYQGASATVLNRVAEVPASTRTYTAQGLTVGTHYFAVTAVTTTGAESAFSAVGSKTIVAAPPPPPVDCVVSEWSAWAPGPAGQETRTRTVVTPAANGGAACPVLSESRPVAPPPVDPCVADPLVITNLAWPGATTGRRSIGYNSGERVIVEVKYTSPSQLQFTDSRGCLAIANR